MGLHAADVLKLERPADDAVGAAAGSTRPMLSSANFQPFGDRDQSVMDGLLRRQASLCLCALRNLSGPRCYMLPLRQSGLGDCGRPDLHLKLWGQWLHTHAIQPPLACMQVSPGARLQELRKLSCVLLSARFPLRGAGGCGG